MTNKKLKVAVHYEDDIRKDNYCHRWIKYLKRRDINVYPVNFKQTDIIRKLKDCDGAMWHWSHCPASHGTEHFLITLSYSSLA